MAITMPKTEVTFLQQATSLITRSARGVAILIDMDRIGSRGRRTDGRTEL